MTLTREDYDQITVLAISGELTLDTVEPFRKTATECLSQKARDFVLDLSQTEFVDSKGLETLLWLQQTCAENLGQIRLAGLTPNLEKVLQVTRLTPRFDCHPEVEAAIKSLRN